MTVGELLQRCSSRELTEWMVFYELEPFGAEAGYLGHAITSAAVMNSQRGKKGKAVQPKDFLPKFGKKKPQSTEAMLAFARQMTQGFGGK